MAGLTLLHTLTSTVCAVRLSGIILFLEDFAALTGFLPFVLDTGGSVTITPPRVVAEPGTWFVFGVTGLLGFIAVSTVASPLSSVGQTQTIPISLSPFSCKSPLSISPAALSAVCRS
jgi:hypothetical protein